MPSFKDNVARKAAKARGEKMMVTKMPRPPTPLKKAVTAMVKAAVARGRENKTIGNLIENVVQHNSAIGTADCVPVLPAIPSGTGSWQRVGDRIEPKSLSIRGIVSLTRVDGYVGLGDMYVRIMVLSQKNIKTNTQVTAGVATGQLLRPNYAALRETDFGGLTNDINLPINTDLFRVYYDKVVKLTGATQDNTSELTRYSHRWKYSFKSALPAHLTFDEGNGNFCNNFAPFVAVGYCYADGTSPDVIATRVTATHNATLAFEDA